MAVSSKLKQKKSISPARVIHKPRFIQPFTAKDFKRYAHFKPASDRYLPRKKFFIKFCSVELLPTFATTLRGRAEVARRAHNPKVSGSNPLLATKRKIPKYFTSEFFVYAWYLFPLFPLPVKRFQQYFPAFKTSL